MIDEKRNLQLIAENIGTPLAEKRNIETPAEPVIISIIGRWELNRRRERGKWVSEISPRVHCVRALALDQNSNQDDLSHLPQVSALQPEKLTTSRDGRDGSPFNILISSQCRFAAVLKALKISVIVINEPT